MISQRNLFLCTYVEKYIFPIVIPGLSFSPPKVMYETPNTYITNIINDVITSTRMLERPLVTRIEATKATTAPITPRLMPQLVRLQNSSSRNKAAKNPGFLQVKSWKVYER
jgi:hypothetical protein